MPGVWWVGTALLFIAGIVAPYQPLNFAAGLRLAGLFGVPVALALVAPAIPIRWLVVLLPVDYLVAYWRLFAGHYKPDQVTATWFVVAYLLTALVCSLILGSRRREPRA